MALQRFAWLKATCPDATYRDASTAKELIDQAFALGEGIACFAGYPGRRPGRQRRV